MTKAIEIVAADEEEIFRVLDDACFLKEVNPDELEKLASAADSLLVTEVDKFVSMGVERVLNVCRPNPDVATIARWYNS